MEVALVDIEHPCCSKYYMYVLDEKGHCNANLLIQLKTVFTTTCTCVQFERFNE